MDHPLGLGAQKFADLVGQKSGGKMKVTVYPGGSLGGDVQTMSALQGGTLDFMTVTAGLLVGVSKPFGVLDFPYLFSDVKEADAIVDGPIGQKLQTQLAEKGLIGLGYWDLGFRNVTNSKHPITKLEDMKGLKLRTLQSPIFIDMFSALGASPVPMSFTELYGAIEQRAVDGQENPVAVIAFAKFYEVQKYLSLTRHAYGAQSFMISKKTWDKPTPTSRRCSRARRPKPGATSDRCRAISTRRSSESSRRAACRSTSSRRRRSRASAKSCSRSSRSTRRRSASRSSTSECRTCEDARRQALGNRGRFPS